MSAVERLAEALRNLEQTRDDIVESWACEDASNRAAMLMCALRYVHDAMSDITIAKIEVEARDRCADQPIPFVPTEDRQ